MSTLALIPARGGSKGLPRKNLVPLGDAPLVVHTIRHAHAAARVDRVVVSTEDAEIAEVVRQAGAEVIDRPMTLAGDEASSESALIHALETLAADGYEPDRVVFLQATSPIRPSGAIDEAIDMLERESADSLVSVVPFHGFLWQRSGTAETAEPLDYDPRERPRRQDRPPTFVENGSIYVFKPWVLSELGCRLGGKIALFPMPASSAIDIDDADDLALAAAILSTETR